MPRIADVLHTLFATNEPLDQVCSRFFAKDYRQRVNGHWLLRDEAVAHFEHLQKIVDTVQVRVLGELMQELKYADRHVVTVHKKKRFRDCARGVFVCRAGCPGQVPHNRGSDVDARRYGASSNDRVCYIVGANVVVWFMWRDARLFVGSIKWAPFFPHRLCHAATPSVGASRRAGPEAAA